MSTGSPSWKDAVQSDSEQLSQIQSPEKAEDQTAGRDDGEHLGQCSSLSRSVISGPKKILSGSMLLHNVLSPKRFIGDGDREYLQPRHQSERNYSGPLQYFPKKEISNHTAVEDTSEGAFVQRKGRFQVMSSEQSPKCSTNSFFSPVSGGLTSSTTPSLTAASVLPSLQYILQQNTMQREELHKLIKYLEQTSGGNSMEFADAGPNDLSQIPPVFAREKDLQSQVIQLQQSIGSLVEELQRQNMKNAQLEAKLNALLKEEEKL